MKNKADNHMRVIDQLKKDLRKKDLEMKEVRSKM